MAVCLSVLKLVLQVKFSLYDFVIVFFSTCHAMAFYLKFANELFIIILNLSLAFTCMVVDVSAK